MLSLLEVQFKEKKIECFYQLQLSFCLTKYHENTFLWKLVDSV